MDKFDIGETAICWRHVKNAAGKLVAPGTSMKVAINRISPNYEADIVSSESMTVTAGVTGTYHYDFASAGKEAGIYEAVYTAVDGTRTTIEKDEFLLE